MFKKNAIDTHLKDARKHLKSGEILKARDSYLKVLSMNPDNITALNNLSQIYSILNEPGKAQGYSEILLEKCDERLEKEKSEKNLMLKSNALISLKRFDEADEVIDEILKINPENIVSLFQKSHHHESENRLNDALECIDEILKIEKYDIAANLSKARILIKLKEYGNAEKHLGLVFKIDPKNKAAMNLKSRLIKEKNNTTISAHDFMIKALDFWEMEDFKKSLAYFDKAIDLDSGYDEIWYLRGELLIRMCQITNAINSFKTAFKLNPESGGIVKKKEFFRFLNTLKRVNTILGYEK